ncbi:MAG: NUDIX domain-containing protein [Patescibacteria group bacterium]|nr:NUDIX domain-containing protein [Patescibacteria group bacterium]
MPDFKNEEATVLAHDVLGNIKEIPVKDLKLRVSVYGILKQGDKFLVQRYPKINKYGIPGGAIELGETINEALVREFQEETGLIVKPVKLLEVKEDFFFHLDKQAHSILLFYVVEKVSGKLLTENNGDDSDLAVFSSFEELKKAGLQKLQLEVLSKALSYDKI